MSDRTRRIMDLVRDKTVQGEQPNFKLNEMKVVKDYSMPSVDSTATKPKETPTDFSLATCSNTNETTFQDENFPYVSDAEDDDDSVCDPTYEAESSSSSSEMPMENIGAQEHIVADSVLQDNQNMLTGRPRKGRKRKYSNQNRSERKRKRNSNESYYNHKGRKIEPKIFVYFNCKCKLKCSDYVSEEICRAEFERFWSLASYDSQVNFIAAGVQQRPKKRVYGRNPEKRTYSRTYKIQNTIVCREMYCKTLGITSFRVNTSLKKFHGVLPITDQRGIKQGGHNKLDEKKVEEVRTQIDKIPKYESHYRREQTDSKFLPPEMTIQNMYSMYSNETENPVSLASYKKIFYTNFNLKFKSLKKDTCNICDKLAIQVKHEDDPTNKKTLEEIHKTHLDAATYAQDLRRQDFKLAKENEDYECLTFDLEKTLPLPRIPANIAFYKRQLWLYNCGVHSGKYDQAYFYVWPEGTAGRGAQEVGSCLLKHVVLKLPKNVSHLILWSDSCGGQNRNIKITLLLKHILHSCPNLNDITLKFVYPGHSFLPNDSDFGDVENALKHTQRLYLPSDYVTIMRDCRKKKPFIVTNMMTTDFVSTSKLEKSIVNRKVSVTGNKINWLWIRSIHIEKNDPFSIMVKQNDFTAVEENINIQKNTRQNSKEEVFLDVPLLWPNGKTVAEKKIKDLKDMMHLIPPDCHDFYKSLKGNPNIEEDVDGFNINNVDFDIEDVV